MFYRGIGINILITIVIAVVLYLSLPLLLYARVTGVCSNCHTMHNSQNGLPIDEEGPFPVLLRADCLGCHGMGISANIDPLTNAPQVYHSGSPDLAGGNFAYILSGGDNRGHNVVDLGDPEGIHIQIPGAFLGAEHTDVINVTELTCAGDSGCHGPRLAASGRSNLAALRGAHHKDEEGQLTVADSDYNSFRFLWGVKGYEDNDWQATSSPTDHNEYYGVSSPLELTGGSCNECHEAQSVKAIQGTISGFCATCHGNFHTLSGEGEGHYGTGSGIGPGVNSPFQRHPADIILPSTGEYLAYVSYSLQAPVARSFVASGPSSIVNPGADIVMCLSCHRAHASNYPDMLRWDKSGMLTGTTGSAADTGCFTCHRDKDGT